MKPTGSEKSAKAEREKRLAEALRANLKRRKVRQPVHPAADVPDRTDGDGR